MRIEQAAKILSGMYAKAPLKEKVLSIHLFGIKYADEIAEMPLSEIVSLAGVSPTYSTEIRKAIKLAAHVTLRDEN